jgi:hypothetical protein
MEPFRNRQRVTVPSLCSSVYAAGRCIAGFAAEFLHVQAATLRRVVRRGVANCESIEGGGRYVCRQPSQVQITCNFVNGRWLTVQVMDHSGKGRANCLWLAPG